MKTDKTLTMKQIILRSCTMLFVIPLLVFWGILFYYSARTIHKSFIDEQQSVVRLMNLVLEKQLNQMNLNLNRISLDSEIQRILEETEFTSFNSKLVNDFRYLDQFMNSINVNNDLKLESAILVNSDGEVYSSNYVSKQYMNEVVLKEWYPVVHAQKGRSVIVGVTENEAGEEILVTGRMVISPKTLHVIGALFTTYNSDELFQPLENQLSDSSDIYIVKHDNSVLYSDAPDRNEFAEFLRDNYAVLEQEGYIEAGKLGQKVIYIAAPEKHIAISVFLRVSFSAVLAKLYRQQTGIIFLGLLCIALFVLFLLYINRKLYKPIEQMTKSHGKQDAREGAGSDCYELKQISDTIMSLTKKTTDGEEQIVRLIEKCESVTLEKLQAQINPHFLYNTLTNIKYISVLNHQDQISQLISALVKLLRSTVGRDGNQILLSEEVENVEHYMLIQNVVYNGNIQFTIDIEPQLGDLLIPNFILQPLVENCIFHGIYPSEKGGEITIRGYLEEEELVLEIQDNGIGFSEDSLINFMQTGEKHNSEHLTNMGIKTVHQKIQLICGEAYGIKIFSRENEGSVVRINLPCSAAKEEEE